MIAATPLPRQPNAEAAPITTPSWQADFAAAITDPAELAAMLGLPDSWVAPAREAARSFPLRVPRSFVARMRHGDPTDPLLRQVLPLAEELAPTTGRSSDPLQESEARLKAMAGNVPGLVFRLERDGPQEPYRGRCLGCVPIGWSSPAGVTASASVCCSDPVDAALPRGNSPTRPER